MRLFILWDANGSERLASHEENIAFI